MVQTQFWFQSWINQWIGSWTNQFWNFTTKQPSVSNTKTTTNSRFPWLTDDEIKRIEDWTKEIADPSEKRIIQNNLYQAMLKDKTNQDYMNDRYSVTNEMSYQADKSTDKQQQNISKAQVRYMELANLIKDKKWLDATANDEEIINYLLSTTQNWDQLMQDYLNWKSDELLYVNWLMEKPWFWEKALQQVKNAAWAAYDSVTWLPRFLSDNLAKAVWWTAKKLWADEDKVNELVQSYIDFWENEMSWKAIWADEDSWTYKVTKFVWDTAQVLAWEWLLKWTSKWAQLMAKLDKAPVWQKMIAWWLEWVWETTLYDIIANQELPEWKELALWWAIWAAIPWLWWTANKAKTAIQKWLKKTASKLELSWMLNPAKLTKVKEQLIDEWVDLAQSKADDVWTWMIERGMKWNKNTIINQLDDYWKKAKWLKTELLATSETTYKSPAAKKALQNLYDSIDDIPWLEEEAWKISKLLKKSKYTLSELDNVKSIMDDAYNLYTTAWTETAWLKAKWLRNIRKELRKFIEDKATEEWLWNIKMINNEISVAHWLKEWISKKDSADAARELLSVFDKWTIGAILGWWAWYTVWPFDSNTPQWKIGNMIVWALAWKYLFSTQAKTNLAAWLNKLSWWTKKELARYIASEWAEKLSETTLKSIWKVVEESGIEWITEWVKDLLSKADLTRLWIIGLTTNDDK